MNDYCVHGTMKLLQNGAITAKQATEIVGMWIELTARKFYKEGELDGKRQGQKKSWQAIKDMEPESDEKPCLSPLDMVGVHSGLTGEKDGQ